MAALKKKDDDMRAMEERYKMYLEKARNVSYVGLVLLIPLTWGEIHWNINAVLFIPPSCLKVIRALDPKLNPATAEIQALRNQLADRDKQILSLEVNPLFN